MLDRLMRLFGYRRRFFPPSDIHRQEEGTLFRRCISTWIASARP